MVTKVEEGVSFKELKYLMASILNHNANVRFKLLVNEKWSQSYLRVLLVTEKGVIVNDERTNKTTSIKSLTYVTEFELDKAYDNFARNFRYKIECQA